MQRPRHRPFRGTMLCCCAIVGLSVVVPLQSSYAQSTPWQSEPGMFCQEDSLGFPSPYSRPDTAHTYRRVFIETQPRMLHARVQVLSSEWTIPGENRSQGIEPPSAPPPKEAPVPAPPEEQPVPLPPEADSAAMRDFPGSPGRSTPTEFFDTRFQREAAAIPRNADLLDAIFPPTSSTHRLTTPIPLPDYFQQNPQSAQVPSQRNGLVLDHVVGQSALSSRVRNPAHTVAPIPDLDSRFDDTGRGGRSHTPPVVHASGATTSPTANRRRVGEEADAGWLGGKLLGRSFADDPHSVFRAGVEQNQRVLDRSPMR